jgi:glycosyltransferase involved in cell wall biosynthesis
MHGGALDLVEHGVNGLLFEPNNAADLALKIQALLMQSHGEYASMRLSARRQAEKFTANLTITKLEHIYKALDSH